MHNLPARFNIPTSCKPSNKPTHTSPRLEKTAASRKPRRSSRCSRQPTNTHRNGEDIARTTASPTRPHVHPQSVQHRRRRTQSGPGKSRQTRTDEPPNARTIRSSVHPQPDQRKGSTAANETAKRRPRMSRQTNPYETKPQRQFTFCPTCGRAQKGQVREENDRW